MTAHRVPTDVKALRLNLRRAGDLTRQLERTEETLRGAVTKARKAGATWEQVGEATGMSKQAAWQRWAPAGARLLGEAATS